MTALKKYFAFILCLCISVMPFADVHISYAEGTDADAAVPSTEDITAAPEPEDEGGTESAPEQGSIPESSTVPDNSAEPDATPDSSVAPEPTADNSAAPEPEVTPDSSAAPEPEVTPDSSVAPEPTAEPEPTPEPVIELTVQNEDGIRTGTEFYVNAAGIDGAVYVYELMYDGEAVISGETDSLMAFTVYASGDYELVVMAEGVSARKTINAAPTAPKDITVNAVKIGLGEEYALEISLSPWYAETEFTYKSSGTRYVNVDAEGNVTGVRRGSAYVTVKTANGLSDKAKVTVVKEPSWVKMTADYTELGVGESAQLTRALPSGSYSKSWRLDIIETSAPDVIALSGIGVVTAMNPGTARVRLTIYNELYADVEFTVCPAPSGISLPETASVSVKGPAVQLEAVIDEGSWSRITYVSSDTSVAKVSSDGAVTGIKAGTAEITATTSNGYSATCVVTVLPAPTKLKLNYSTIYVGVGETFELMGTLTPSDAESTLRFKSGNRKYATVDENGVVTALKRGTVYITAYTYNNKSARCKVVICSAPSKVTLSAERLVLGYDAGSGIGESAALKATLPKNTASLNMTWSISAASAEGVVTVDDAGNVTAAGIGWADVTVTTHNGKTDTCRVEVLPATTSIAIEPELRLGSGNKTVLTVTTDEGSAGRLTFVSSDKAVVTVDGKGNVKAVKAGTAEITVASFNGVSAVCKVTVLPAPTKLKLEPTTVYVGVGDTFRLEGVISPAGAESELHFKTSNGKYATVDENGVVTAAKRGTVYITAYTYNNKSARCKVVIRSAPSKVTLSAHELTLGYDAAAGIGESAKLKASLPKDTAASFSWSISAESAPGVVTVDEGGKIVAAGVGWADVTVTTHNGKTDTCRVTVESAASAITAAPSDSTVIGVGQTLKVAAAAEGGYAGKITYSVEPAGTASVDSNGVVKGVKPGTATVTAATFNGLTASFEIEVKAAPSKVTVPSRKITLGVGETYTVNPSIPESSMTEFSYSSGKTSVASVDENGVITARKKGSATITVRTHNNKKTTITVTVKAAPSKVEFKKSEVVLHPGDSIKPGVSIPKNTDASYTYSSSAPDTAVISSDGTITAVSVGTAEMTVTTHNGKTDTISVRVIAPPAVIEYTGGGSEVTGIGMMSELPVRVLTEDGSIYEGNVSVTSSSTSVLAVNSTHMLGKKTGSVTVTVSAGELTCSFRVQVKKYSEVCPPELVSHRGNGSGYPENSMEAVLAAASTGATWVEIDVRLTSDGVLVVFHDSTLDRMTNGTGKVSDMTYAELCELDMHGSRICTLDEMICAISLTDTNVWLEIKDADVAEGAVAIVQKYGMSDRTVYNSSNHDEIYMVLEIDPGAMTALTYTKSQWKVDAIIQNALDRGIYSIYPSYSFVTEADAAKIHRYGIKLSVYTVKTVEAFEKAVKVGADYVITDIPEKLHPLMQ